MKTEEIRDCTDLETAYGPIGPVSIQVNVHRATKRNSTYTFAPLLSDGDIYYNRACCSPAAFRLVSEAEGRETAVLKGVVVCADDTILQNDEHREFNWKLAARLYSGGRELPDIMEWIAAGSPNHKCDRSKEMTAVQQGVFVIIRECECKDENHLVALKEELARETRKTLGREGCPVTLCCIKKGLPGILFKQKHNDPFILDDIPYFETTSMPKGAELFATGGYRWWENVRDSFYYLPVHGIAYDKEEFWEVPHEPKPGYAFGMGHGQP